MIALYKGTSFLSRLIRWFTWSEYSHAAWLCEDGSVIEAWQGGGVRHVASLGAQHKAGTPVDMFFVYGHGDNLLTTCQRNAVENFLLEQVGEKYDYLGILGFLSRKRMEAHDAWFCSELIFKALNHAGIYPLLRTPACKVSPGLLAISPLLKFQRTVTLP